VNWKKKREEQVSPGDNTQRSARRNRAVAPSQHVREEEETATSTTTIGKAQTAPVFQHKTTDGIDGSDAPE
jgi:hypothetical protein